jgi:hypothetical protein
MHDQQKEAGKRLKAETVAARTKRKHDLEQNLPSLLPWKRIGKWATGVILVIAIGVGIHFYVKSRPKPVVPIEWDRCPTVVELVGTIEATRNGQAVEISMDKPVPPGTLLKPKQGSTLRLAFKDDSRIGLFPSSRVRTDANYEQAITLEAGSLFVAAKSTPVQVKSIYGVATCTNAITNFDLSRSRLRCDCQKGEVIMTNVTHNRKLRIRPNVPGEIGLGADAFGIKTSEEDEDMTYPMLEVKKISLINADKNTSYPSFNPLRDGAVFVQTELTPKKYDFQVMTNSTKVVKLVVRIYRMTTGKLAGVHDLESVPVTVKKQQVFGVFGSEKTKDDHVSFKGAEIPPGDYLMTITPYGPPRDKKPGRGRGVTIRFSMVD